MLAARKDSTRRKAGVGGRAGGWGIRERGGREEAK